MPTERAPRAPRATRATRVRPAVVAARHRALVIVESPTKARTIGQFLGAGYMVESSIGHIRDLPSSAVEIPAAQKKERWARLGVDVDHDFQPLYIIPANKKAQVTRLRDLLKDADELFLATDEDREGEAIAWHLAEVLRAKVPVRRMVFHEITEQAIHEALEHPREVDRDLVAAQEARRILDRLYGYEVSPVIWKKVRPRLSAGRVQSAALRVLVDRERARMHFVQASYWDVDSTATIAADARPAQDDSRNVALRLTEVGGRRVASGRDFDPEHGTLVATHEAVLLDETTARTIAATVAQATFTVGSVTERPFTQRPPAPFVTSTLQQEAGRQLHFSAQHTMRVAQQLYENGYITYMRTDSTNLSEQALNAARRQIEELYGADYVPPQPRTYQTRTRGAQEAHEAIRPVGDIFRVPERLRGELNGDLFRLYDLVWKRTLASQMRDATGLRTSARLQAPAGAHGEAVFAASGKVITFPGFLRAYVEGSDDPDAELEDQERLLPPLVEQQQLTGVGADARGHQTQPTARFTEASLVHELEERGIGRPSTYASIIETIQDRGYAWKRGTALVPTFTAFAVVNLLEQHFPELIDLDFTARMEDDLDRVAEGTLEAVPWLRRFYFGLPDDPDPAADALSREGLKQRIGTGWEAIDARAVSSILVGRDEQNREIAVHVGRYGPYVQAGDDDPRATIPDDVPPDELTLARALEFLHEAGQEDRSLGIGEPSGQPVFLKRGRYGPYVQLGPDDAATGADGKPRRASLWPKYTVDTLTLEQAQQLLSFPKVLGVRPDSDEPVTAQDGPRGPYVRCGKESRSLEGGYDQLATITLDEALMLLSQPRRGRGFAAAQALRVVGPHPQSGTPIELRSGRFGPYVTDGVVNASLPRGTDPGALTVDQAVRLLEARAERMREQGQDPAAPRTRGRPRTGTARPRTAARTPRATPRAATPRPERRSA